MSIEKFNRPSWDEYFFSIAYVVATRSTCPRAKCGTVLVHPTSKHILATGYNGAPPNEPHCYETGCNMEDGHCQTAIHSEVNAIAHAARCGVQVDGALAYIVKINNTSKSTGPCRECMKVVKAANIQIVEPTRYFTSDKFIYDILQKSYLTNVL